MAVGSAVVGTGSTLAFGTTTTFEPIMTRIAHSGISRVALDTSHMGSTPARTFTPGELYDGGEVTIDFYLDNYSNVNKIPPFTTAAETITIKWGLGTGFSTAFSGFITNWDWDDPVEDLITGSVTIKVAGAITHTAAS